jgi:hypothetical protein
LRRGGRTKNPIETGIKQPLARIFTAMLDKRLIAEVEESSKIPIALSLTDSR